MWVKVVGRLPARSYSPYGEYEQTVNRQGAQAPCLSWEAGTAVALKGKGTDGPYGPWQGALCPLGGTDWPKACPREQ